MLTLGLGQPTLCLPLFIHSLNNYITKKYILDSPLCCRLGDWQVWKPQFPVSRVDPIKKGKMYRLHHDVGEENESH